MPGKLLPLPPSSSASPSGKMTTWVLMPPSPFARRLMASNTPSWDPLAARSTTMHSMPRMILRRGGGRCSSVGSASEHKMVHRR
jgi:hypothetical protein